jgi:hypothetical protein
MKRHTTLAVILFTFLLAGGSSISAQEEPKPAPKPEGKANWYKIEITMNEFQEGKKTNTRSYTMEARENGAPAQMKLGDKVPVATSGFKGAEGGNLVNVQFEYIDVGLNISSSVKEQEGRLGLTISIDQSSLVTPSEPLGEAPKQPIPMIREIRMDNTAFVTLGKPSLVASVDDPGKENHKYTVEATVTKLNP